MDEAHKRTDAEIKTLEKKIAKEYRSAYKDLDGKVKAYFQAFEARDAEQQKLVETGEVTDEQYRAWRVAQIGRGERFAALREQVGQRLVNAATVADAYINDTTPGIYALNANYSAYTIDTQTGGSVNYILTNEQAVKRLIADNPKMLPPRKTPIPKATKWNMNLFTSQITQGLLTGESVGKVAKRLQAVTVTSRAAALRSARTAMTGAQNAGRTAAYQKAEDMGIQLQKEWSCTFDERTRTSHRLLDGERVDNDKTFSNGCRFPGDPQGKPAEVYNCRCTLVAHLPGVDDQEPVMRRVRDPETGRNVLVEDMTYQQWEKWKKRAQEPSTGDTIRNIDIDDLKSLTYNTGMDHAAVKYIGDYVKDLENRKGFYINYVSKEIQSTGERGTPIFQIEPVSYGRGPVLLQLNINVEALSGKSVTQIDEMFYHSENTVVDSLADALTHEAGHAKLVKGLTASQISDVYAYLKTYSFPEISQIAEADGAEAIAELEVLLSREMPVSDEAKAFYNTFMGGQSK